MALTPSGERYIQCPYEESHVIIESRFQCHLVKCQKVHRHSRLVDCPFNATHKVPEIELNCHKTYLCPDRNKVETFIKSTTDSNPLFPVQNLNITSSEDWDDVEIPTYNPEDHCKTMPVLMNLQGATPSERKGFRAAERQRYRHMNNDSAPKQGPSGNKTASRLPQTKPVALLEQMENNSTAPFQANTFQQLNGNGVKTDEDDFIVPKYSRGRGRGRTQ
ncbi:asterix [Carabus blaptoides fortunei]